LNAIMFAAMTAGAGHPAVSVLLGLGAVLLAGVVVAMAWNVHVRQIRLAGQLARRQFILASGKGGADADSDLQVVLDEPDAAAGGAAAPPVVIDGPETVIVGEQVRYRARCARGCTVVAWAVGGGSVSQAPDPAHADELLLIADQPADLTIFVRAREGMLERRATKSVTAEEDVASPVPPFTLRLFLQAWGLVVVAVLVIGFAGALVALGSLSSADFIALVAPLATLLGVVAALRGADDVPRLGKGTAAAMPRALRAYPAADLHPGGRNGRHQADADRPAS
jgi:hypothetical protein